MAPPNDPARDANRHRGSAAARRCAVAAYAKYVERIGKEPAPIVADFEAIEADGNLYVFDGEVGDADVAGFIVFYGAGDAMHIENVAVAPRDQGRGLGAQLIAFAETAARKAGFGRVELYTNEMMTENLDYYRSKGYMEIGRAEQDGFKRVFHRKRLPS